MLLPPIDPTLEHHPYGPSTHPMLAECPKYEGQSTDALDDAESCDDEAHEEEEQTDAKARGTAQHAALALYIAGNPEWAKGLSSWEASNVLWVATKAIQLAEERGFTQADIQCERRAVYRGRDFSILGWGTLDLRFGTTTLDAKFGLQRNYFPQLSTYALADMQATGRPRWEVGILYGKLRKVVLHQVTLETCQAITFGVIDRKLSPYSKPSPCSYCGWCKHLTTCESINAPLNALSVVDNRPSWGTVMQAAKESPAHVRAGLLLHLVERYLKPLEKRAKEEAFLCSTTPTGYSIQTSKPRPHIDDAQAAFSALRANGVRDSDITSVIPTVKPAILLRAYKHRYPDAEDRAALDEVIKILGPIYQPGAPSKRMAADKDAEAKLRAALNTQ